MRYEDFVIQISSRSGGEYMARVIQSPAGEGFNRFRLPFRKEEIGALLNTLAQTMASARNPTIEAARELDPMTAAYSLLTPRQMGDALFKALFAGDVLSLYDRSLGRVETASEVGLRIKIKLDPKEQTLAQLHCIPWEVLHRRATQEFLSLSRLSPVVRYLEVARPVKTLALPNPLRILAVLASPANMGGLDLERERRNLQQIWTGQGQVEVHILKQARLDALRAALLERPFHVLHYMGHGGYLDSEQKGLLYFQKEDGRSEPVSGANLATHLGDFHSLRLVFLNACNTARATGQAGLNPFSGVATALVMGGLPAVLAMQFPISDQAAITFSQTVYRRLAMGDSVDTAVVEGRIAVRAREERTAEWGTPVLFTRIPDGKLFERAEQPRPRDTGPGERQTTASYSELNPPSTRSQSPMRLVFMFLALALLSGLIAVFRNQWAPPLRSWIASLGSVPTESGDGASSKTSEPESIKEEAPPSDKQKAEIRTKEPDFAAGARQTFPLVEGASIEMVWIPAGAFTMGSPADEPGRHSDETWRQVTLTRGFWMGRTEVTQRQWEAVMRHNPSEFKGEDLPVERVSWFSVHDFLFVVNLKAKNKGRFRLPTEAEWEYAARAGSRGAFAGNPVDIAWYRDNADRTTHPVAAKEPNAWGLHDMHGNVWEWCADWKADYGRSARTDPRGPASGSHRIIRGGGWSQNLSVCRSANRDSVGPTTVVNELGFRLVRTPD